MRIGWADNLKFLGITLIILGHLHIPLPYLQYLYSFHVPLFFFISGFIFDGSRYEGYREYLGKRTRSLLVPYFAFAFLAWVHWFYNKTRIDPMEYILRNRDHYFLDPLTKILYSNELSPFNEPLWFLTCLFLVVNLYYPIQRYIRKWQWVVAVLFLLSLMGYLYGQNIERGLPWHLEVVPMGAFFFGMGNISRPLLNRLNRAMSGRSAGWAALLLPGLFAINIIGSNLNGRVGLFSNIYGDLWYFLAASLSGILFYITISMILPSNRLFELYGKNTIIIYCTHLFLIHNTIFDLHGWLFPEISYGHLPLWLGAVYCIIILTLMIPIILIVNRFFPFLVGRPCRKNRKKS